MMKRVAAALAVGAFLGTLTEAGAGSARRPTLDTRPCTNRVRLEFPTA